MAVIPRLLTDQLLARIFRWPATEPPELRRPFEGHRDGAASIVTERCKPPPGIALGHGVRQGYHNARAAGPDRVAEGDCSARVIRRLSAGE